MLSLEIRLLTARFAAAAVTNPNAAEWPPHPARVYSALTSALYDVPGPDPSEHRAVAWLAAAGAPEILASDAWPRQLGRIYVPINDPKVLADIDTHIERLAQAEQHLANSQGQERNKAEHVVRNAEMRLAERSLATSQDNGRGSPSNARELIDRRTNPQPRWFPASVPHEDLVHLCWDVAPGADVLEALDRVASRVARLGHSSSLVALRFRTGPVEKGERRRLVPDDRGDRYMRVPLPDQLERLRAQHQRHRQVEQRILPARQVRYRVVSMDVPDEQLPHTTFADLDQEWIVFEVVAPPDGGRRHLIDVSLTQRVARAMRGTLFRHIDIELSPASLTGHDSDGSPATVPHLAYVPLADVGFRYSSGSILGLALVPPRDFEVRSRDLLLEAIYQAEAEARQSRAEPPLLEEGPPPLRLTLGRHGVLHLRRLREPTPIRAISPNRWTMAADRWYTATAIALSRNPGNLLSRDPRVLARAAKEAERTIAADCRNLGLPEPAAVWVHRRSLLNGTPAAHRFMPFPDERGGLRRVCVHAEIVFDRRVRGPLLVGSGRFFGVGLCAPAPMARGDV